MLKKKRSATGHHVLLPASNSHGDEVLVPLVPTHDVVAWTFGRGTVLWTIWPAVLLHTVFAAIVTVVSLTTKYYLGVPQVLITVLGVVIGFVIAYRASSGYDRYWMGRCCWSDLTKNARTMGRLIWFHVPLKASKDVKAEDSSAEREVNRLMREKRLAIDLIEGFVVALKHHLRGEMGYYYEDLYHLIHPLHDHTAGKRGVQHPQAEQGHSAEAIASQTSSSHVDCHTEQRDSHLTALYDPIIPSINSYGTFDPETPSQTRQRGRVVRRASSSASCASSTSSRGHDHPFLWPSKHKKESARVSTELIPFSSIFPSLYKILPQRQVFVQGEEDGEGGGKLALRRRIQIKNRKERPKVAGGGENIPLEILRCLSEWVAIIDERGTVAGNPLGGMYGCLSAFEDSLSALERILTTPLPFVYSAHISAVWLYLFLLPFQLVDQFDWFTIPGVGIAAFFYIGFLAAGEEIEQPFGYDDNDLDLDLFCREIVHADIESLKRTPCPNVRLPAKHQTYRGAYRSSGIAGAANATHAESEGVQDVFGILP